MAGGRRIQRIHRSRDEIDAILSRYQASRLSRRAFARVEGIPATSLSNWLGRHRGPPTPALVPVQVVASEAGSGAPLELVLANGRTIRVGPGFDAEELCRLIATVEGGC
ncbi:MAG: hypothetical protein JSW43_04930 [Gemmatimonadota bacterium]|nr:MAG: hypothetical protein JSW43_04930 [Gemmatimonadota bacterium]